MKHGLRTATAAGLLLTSLFVSPAVASAANERGEASSEPSAWSELWNTAGDLAVEFERISGHADGAPKK